MTFLLAVLQSAALVVLEHAVSAAEVTGAEVAVANDTLRLLPALLETAADLLGRHDVGE